eukprot:scaffold181607_cov17-Tisochrysis_lutea.AAC.1
MKVSAHSHLKGRFQEGPVAADAHLHVFTIQAVLAEGVCIHLRCVSGNEHGFENNVFCNINNIAPRKIGGAIAGRSDGGFADRIFHTSHFLLREEGRKKVKLHLQRLNTAGLG